MRSVLSRLLPPPRTPSACPTPIGTKSPSTASAAASTPSSTSGMRAHSSDCPLPGVPSHLLERPPSSQPLVEPAVDRCRRPPFGTGAVGSPRVAGTSSGMVSNCASRSNGSMAERGVDREDLPIGDVADGAGLRHLMALDGQRHVDVDDLAGPGVRQVLGGRPDGRPPGRALERLDRGAEPGAAEQEGAARADPRGDRQLPAEPVVRRLEPEEGPCVHASADRTGGRGCPSGRGLRPGLGHLAEITPSCDGTGRCRWRLGSTRWSRHRGPGTRARSSTPSAAASVRRPRSWRRCSRRSTPARSTPSATSIGDRATIAAGVADVSLPFGGVPIGVKELEAVAGWPDTEASVLLADRIATTTSTMVHRIRDLGGAVLAGQTTASEFGGVNLTRTILHGITRNPWQPDRTPGGSSGGSAAAVAGGLLTLATAGDGGGSIRIPAGFCGLVGLKGDVRADPPLARGALRQPHRVGRLPVALGARHRPLVRRLQRPRRPRPAEPAAGRGMGGGARHAHRPPPRLAGRRGRRLGRRHGVTGDVGAPRAGGRRSDRTTLRLERVDGLDAGLPRMGMAWSISGIIAIAAELGDAWPACADDLTPEIRDGLVAAEGKYSAEARARIERRRTEVNEAMARIFDPVDGVDLVITASNPDVAFAADGPLPSDVRRGRGRRTQQRPADVPGQPARQPGHLDPGRPARRPADRAAGRSAATSPSRSCSELAHLVERHRPWPLTAETSAEHVVEPVTGPDVGDRVRHIHRLTRPP